VGGACSPYGERRGAYRFLAGKPKGKKILGRPRSKWDDYIKIDLQELGLGALNRFIWFRIGTSGGLLYMW
jgi:hypothetical protein